MEVSVYTASFGRYDSLRAQAIQGCPLICYTERADRFAPPPWELRVREVTLPVEKEVRRYKLQPHRYIETEYSIYIDANFVMTIDPKEAIRRFLGDADIALYRHPERQCIYAEAEACIAFNRAPRAVLEHQVRTYERAGYPRNNGLFECGVLLRRHTDRVQRLCDAWWEEVQRHSARDQVSFPYVCWKLGIKPKVIEGKCQKNPLFVWRHHGLDEPRDADRPRAV